MKERPASKVPERRSPWVIDAVIAMARQGVLPYFEGTWRRHGDLVRLQIGSQVRYLAIHPEHVRHISISNRKNYDKRASYDAVRELLLGNGLVTSTGALWKRQRGLMSPFYTPRGIQAFVPMMIADAQQFGARWEELAAAEGQVEMIDEMMLVTASIILKAMFSTQSDEQLETLKDAVETMIRFVSAQQMNPLSAPLWVPTRRNRAYWAASQRVHAFIAEVLAQRRALPDEAWPDDLLSKLMLARDEDTGEGMSDELLRDEAVTTFFAGHETTARTMAFAWYALSQHPQVAARLHAEVDAALGDGVPTVEALKQMPYTLQVIKETLRLYPPAPMYARDAVGDDEIDGVPIPAGSQVLLLPYCTHRHPDFWEQLEVFDPDRWEPEREKQRHPYAYHPFAAGQRICIGNNFSLLESHILLAMLARRFAPRLLPGHRPQIDMGGTLISRNGLPMFIERRG